MASDTAPPDKTATNLILFVTRKWAPAMGGMETYSMRLSEELAKRTNIKIVALPGRADGRPPGALALFGFPFTLLRKILANRRAITVLHLADMASWPLALMALLIRPAPQIVLSAHGTDVAYHRRETLLGKLYGLYLRLGAKLLPRAKIIANSSATRKVVQETGWRNITIVRLATDIVGPAPDGLHNDTILFAGRLVERKGCGWFIRNVMPLLPPDTRLQVAGTKWDASETAAISAPGVEFLGKLHGDTLIAAYRAAKCVIIPNVKVSTGEYEGFGLVAAEAAAAGGLVLAARSGGLTDAVIHEKTGFLLPSGDPQSWASAIAGITDWDRERRQNFATTAMQLCGQVYVWDRVATETLTVYQTAGSAS